MCVCVCVCGGRWVPFLTSLEKGSTEERRVVETKGEQLSGSVACSKAAAQAGSRSPADTLLTGGRTRGERRRSSRIPAL